MPEANVLSLHKTGQIAQNGFKKGENPTTGLGNGNQVQMCDVAVTALIRLELVIDSDLVSCGVEGNIALAYFYVCGVFFCFFLTGC